MCLHFHKLEGVGISITVPISNFSPLSSSIIKIVNAGKGRGEFLLFQFSYCFNDEHLTSK